MVVWGHPAEPRTGADDLPPSLFSGFQQQLTPSVRLRQSPITYLSRKPKLSAVQVA